MIDPKINIALSAALKAFSTHSGVEVTTIEGEFKAVFESDNDF
ncbi:hypothetical protein [Mucilaginibacter antarcticus]